MKIIVIMHFSQCEKSNRFKKVVLQRLLARYDWQILNLLNEDHLTRKQTHRGYWTIFHTTSVGRDRHYFRLGLKVIVFQIEFHFSWLCIFSTTPRSLRFYASYTQPAAQLKVLCSPDETFHYYLYTIQWQPVLYFDNLKFDIFDAMVFRDCLSCTAYWRISKCLLTSWCKTDF